MGKKKAQKTKELSVAIAEASSAGGGEEEPQSPQVQTPRRRGRPRKINTDKNQMMSGGDDNQPVSVSVSDAEDHLSKKPKIGTQEKEHEEKKVVQVEVEVGERKLLGPRSSRARRKSKPRKSS